MVIKAARLPEPGETIAGGRFVMTPGGKGANQAVAAARLGAEVTLIAKVGHDSFGDQAIEGFQREGIRTEGIRRDAEAATGVALIIVDDRGRNLIAVASGANHRLTPDEIEQGSNAIRNADVLLLQLETPLGTVVRAAQIAADAGVPVVLDPRQRCRCRQNSCASWTISRPTRPRRVNSRAKKSATPHQPCERPSDCSPPACGTSSSRSAPVAHFWPTRTHPCLSQPPQSRPSTQRPPATPSTAPLPGAWQADYLFKKRPKTLAWPPHSQQRARRSNVAADIRRGAELRATPVVAHSPLMRSWRPTKK